MDKFETIKQQVRIADVVSDFGVVLDRNDKGLCPFHKEKTPSFSVDRKNNIFTCFGCGETGDVVTFVQKIKECEPLEAVQFLAERYRVDIGENFVPKKPSVTDYIKRCLVDIDKTNYFATRGLTRATIRHFCLGYDTGRKAVVIPYSGRMEYYQTRGTEEKTFYKPRTEDAGAEPLFNIEAMRRKTKEPIFVVESPICAMSVYQQGGNAVSTCGTSGWKKIVEEVKKRKPIGGFIVCMDNDEPGRKASEQLCHELDVLGVQWIDCNIAGKYKDPNDLLMANPKELEANIKTAKLALRKKYATQKDSFDAQELQAEDVKPPVWIVQNVLPTGLAMLCAPSKIGKSWMMLQLALAVTQGKDFMDYKTNKCGVLYYALEDSKARLKERMNKILKGKKAPTDLRFVTHADAIDHGFLEKMQEEIKTFPNIKLVIVDTLQKVRGRAIKNETAYSGDYREMGLIKQFADKHNICILFVHHLRKQIDEGDAFNMISGSTALMGAADSIFVISKKKRMDEQATFIMTGRDIIQTDLVISFNKHDYLWEVQGTAEEMALKKERQDYENHPVIVTIKELVKRNPVSGWGGSAQDLMMAVYDITGKQVTESSAGIGKLISRYELMLHYDGIDHKFSRSGKRVHKFAKVVRGIPFGYPRTMFDAPEEDEDSE